MSEFVAANKGQAAIQAADYPAAITHLSEALKVTKSPLWLIWRATAYQRTNQHELALADADNAVLAAVKRSKRDLIATAQFRRAVALHGLKRYGDARMCLLYAQEFNEKEKGLTLWQARVKADYEKSGGKEGEKNQVTVKKIPDEVEEIFKDPEPETKDKTKDKGSVVSVEPVASATPSQTPKEKIRHEWYQSPTIVTVTIFAKGVPKENTEVKIDAGSLEVSFPLAGGDSAYDYTVDPLFSKVDVSKSKFRITPQKIEIELHKATPGLKWSGLEGTDAIPSELVKEEDKPTAILPKPEAAPAYPTSSKTGPKNWDKLVGDENDEEDGDNVDHFFKKLYKDADPDTKRAMMKSYQESNGTSLSTNWADVGSKTFETSPPDGMEAKKWES